MPLNLHHEDLIKGFADKTGISTDQAKKLFGKEITGYSKRTITNEQKLKEVVAGAIRRAEERGIAIEKGGKSGYGLRNSIEKHIKTKGAPDEAQNPPSAPGGLWSNIKSAFGVAQASAPKNGVKKHVDSAEFLKKVRSGSEVAPLQNTQGGAERKAPAKPQRIDLATAGFERLESSSKNEPRAPDIG